MLRTTPGWIVASRGGCPTGRRGELSDQAADVEMGHGAPGGAATAGADAEVECPGVHAQPIADAGCGFTRAARRPAEQLTCGGCRVADRLTIRSVDRALEQLAHHPEGELTLEL